MNILNEFLKNYGTTILYTVFTGIAGYLGLLIKNLYRKYINDKTKEQVVKMCVKAVEQMYVDLRGEEKLQKAIDAASEILTNKGIVITNIELRMFIESAVSEFNDAFNNKSK